MKKSICLILVFCFAFCLVSCKKDKTNADGVDISYYAGLGQIPECEYKLGQDADTVLKELTEKSKKDGASEEDFCDVFEGESKTKIITSNTHYIYNNGEKNISKIVVFDEVYGFPLGTDMNTVKTAQEGFDLKGEEVSLSDEDARDFSGNSSCTYLKFDFEKSTVIFAFEDNALIGASIKSK